MYTTAFFYGANLPVKQLSTYQRVVVEAENIKTAELLYLKEQGVNVYAYLSIGEIYKETSWLTECDKSWILGVNKAWDTKVMDMTHSGWCDFLVHNRVADLMHRGYQGIFLDTMDSYKLLSQRPNDLLTQELGIITLIRSVSQVYSGVELLFNRGFDVLDGVSELAEGVVAESLFTSWNPATSSYQNVSEDDHKWLLDKLRMVQDKYELPITIIDYLPADQQEQGREIAKRIIDLGFSPWITTMAIDVMGINKYDINLYS